MNAAHPTRAEPLAAIFDALAAHRTGRAPLSVDALSALHAALVARVDEVVAALNEVMREESKERSDAAAAEIRARILQSRREMIAEELAVAVAATPDGAVESARYSITTKLTPGKVEYLVKHPPESLVDDPTWGSCIKSELKWDGKRLNALLTTGVPCSFARLVQDLKPVITQKG